MYLKSTLPFVFGFIILFVLVFPAAAQAPGDSSPPSQPVKLIFIHHSTGENWLNDEQGGLGRALEANNYFVSDTNYGWGPDAIGDRTDIVNWQEWFRSPQTPQIMQAVLRESEVHSPYTRTLEDPGGENQIVMFKSCFPNSADMGGSPNDPPAQPDGSLSVGTAKGIYNDLLEYFKTRPDKLFVVITAPPVQDRTNAANARAFDTWLMNDWLREANYSLPNVAVWDFYNVLTGKDHHHRINNGQVEYISKASENTSVYPSAGDDDHPNPQGSRKATEEFVPMLNVFYNRWKAAGALPAAAPQGAQAAPQDAAPPEQPPAPQSGAQPAAGMTNALDDFEGAAPPQTDGWVVYSDETPDTKITCAPQSQTANNGKSALQIDFKVGKSDGWASCSLAFWEAQNWSTSQGLDFWMHSSQAGLPFGVMAHAGTPEQSGSYEQRITSDEKSTQGWTHVFIPWQDIRRVEWEENPGTPVSPEHILSVAFAFNGLENGPNQGTLYIDDLRLGSGGESAEPPAAASQAPGATMTAPAAGAPAAPQAEPTAAPPAKKPSLRGLCPLNTALPVGIGLAALWGVSRRKKRAE